MNTNNNYTAFEKMLHNKVNNFEYPFDKKDWLDFEKKLPKSPKSFTSPKNILKYFAITSAAVISTLVILHFAKNSEKSVNINTISKTQAIAENNKLDNSQSNNSNINNINKTDNKKHYTNSEIKNSAEVKSNETVEINKHLTEQNNFTENNNHTNSPVNKENAIVFNNNENKNISNFSEIIYADVVDGCAPLNVQFSQSVSSDTISYLWEFGDHQTSTLKTPSHNYKKSGIYTISLILKYAKSQQTKKITYSKNINVHEKPIANFDFSVSDDGYDFTFTNSSTNSVYWVWNYGDKSNSKSKNELHTYKHEGIYNVHLIAFNSFGCTDTVDKTVTVKFKAPFFIPNSFIPAGVTQFYGPVGENINPDGYKMSIFDINGKQVFETTNIDIKWDGKAEGINNDAKAGYYYWKISMKDKFNNLQEWSGIVNLMR